MLVSSLQILEIPENKHFLIKSYMYMYVTKMKLIKRRDAYVMLFISCGKQVFLILIGIYFRLNIYVQVV